MIAVGAGLGVLLLPGADLRLLAGVIAAPALFWLLRESRRRQTGITITPQAITITHPFGLRPLGIAAEHIGGAVLWTGEQRLGIAYYRPRPPFEGGDDPRPPLLKLTSTAPLNDGPAALAAIQAQPRTPHPDFPPIPAETLSRHLRLRRLRRAGITVGALFATPLLVIIAARLLHTAANALHLFATG